MRRRTLLSAEVLGSMELESEGEEVGAEEVRLVVGWGPRGK